MTKKLCAIVLGMLMVLSLGGCATLEGLPNLDKDLTQLVGLKPVEKNSNLAVYSCWGATQEFEHWKPKFSTTEIWNDKVLVVDEGSQFTVDSPVTVFESTQLYTTVKDYVDLGFNTTTSERFYRMNKPTLSYVSSTLNSDGDGVGMVFFNCSTDRALIADPNSVEVISK